MSRLRCRPALRNKPAASALSREHGGFRSERNTAQSLKDFMSLRKQIPRAVRKAAISMFVAHDDAGAALDSDAVSRTLLTQYIQ
jgi:hypothetical protein